MNRAGMEAAVAAFLRAAGLDVEGDEQLADTPRRVTQAWAEEFLAGYGQTAAAALSERFPVTAGTAGELVVVTDLRFTSMCPHHLLPYVGRAHLAYLPGDTVVGFGRLSALVEVYARRLILQEQLAREVALALTRELGSPGAACVIEAEQQCLQARGERQGEAVTWSEAYEGRLREEALRAQLWVRLGRRERPGAPSAG